MGRPLHPTRHDHPASTPHAHADASIWAAFFPRLAIDEQASALARDDHAAHSDADEFTARALPVGLQPGAIPPSRLTSFREPVRSPARKAG
jgi:hypothetical protein